METVIDWFRGATGLPKRNADQSLELVAEQLTNKVKELENENNVLAKENIALRRGNEKLVFKLRLRKDGGGDHSDGTHEDQHWDCIPYFYTPQENLSFVDRLRNFLMAPVTKFLLQENEFLKSENEDLLEELKAVKSEITEVRKSFCFY